MGRKDKDLSQQNELPSELLTEVVEAGSCFIAGGQSCPGS